MTSLRFLFQITRRHRGWMIIGLGLGLLTALAGLGLLSLAGWFISAAAFAGLTTALAGAFNYLLPASGVRFFAMVRILSRYAERITTHQATFKILAELRVWLYQKIEPKPPAWLLTQHSGDLLNRLNRDVDILDNAYLRVANPMLIALFTTGFMLFLLHFFSLKIAIVSVLSLLGCLIVIPLLMSWLSHQPGIALTQLTAEFRQRFVTDFQGIADLRIYQTLTEHRQKLQQLQTRFIQAQQAISYQRGWMMALLTMVTGITITAALWIGSHLVASQQLNGANLALIVLALLAAFETLAAIPSAFQCLSQTISAANRVRRTAAATTAPKQQTKHIQLARTDIAFNHISFHYPNRPALFTDFSLRIEDGQHIAFVGPTGAGKSSLIHLLSRFYQPTSGNIQIGGHDINVIDENQLRQIMTIVSQRSHIFNASIRENLLIGNPQASEAALWQALEQAELATCIKNLPQQLDTLTGELGQQLSGGEARRLSIARALLRDTPILIFDEPFVGLDQHTALALQKNLFQFCQNKTLILITHRSDNLPRDICVTI